MGTPVEIAAARGGQASLVGVRAQPGAKRSALVGTWNGLLKLAVAAPPEDGRANEELVELLALLFGLKRRDVALVAGATARRKRFELALPPAEASARLARLLEEHTP